MEAELRYTPDEFFDRYFDFLNDTRVQHKLAQRGIRTWEHEELLFRFHCLHEECRLYRGQKGQ